MVLTDISASVMACAYSYDGKLIVSASWDKTLKIWNAEVLVVLYDKPRHNRSLRHSWKWALFVGIKALSWDALFLPIICTWQAPLKTGF